MKPNFSLICRFTVFAILFILFFSHTAYAQSKEKLDFKYKVESVKVGEEVRYNIKITIVSGEGPFMVGVFENLKEDLIELDKKENVNGPITTLSFEGKKDCVIYLRNNVTGIFKTLKY